MTVMPQVEAALLDAIRRDQQPARGRRPVRRPVLALVAAVCLASGVAFAGAIWPDIREAVRHGAQPPVPSLPVRALDAPGRTSLEQFRGQVVVLSFWAAWCEPCIRQTPVLAAVDRELRATHTGTVVLVSTDETARQAKAALRREQLDVPVILASPDEPEGRAFLRAFLGGTSPLPVTFAVDREGKVAGYTEGATDLSTLRSLLRRAEGAR